MSHLPSILATGAAAVGLLTSAMVVAQVRRPDPADIRARAWQAAHRAEQQRRLNLANQLRPFYRYELMHARAACGLGKEELRKIRPDADAAYQRAIDRLDALGIDARRSRSGLEPDYHEAIRDTVFSVVERHVKPEQRAALQADTRSREAARKEAGVDLLVAVLDRELLLTEPQRRRIAESLAAHWDDRWRDALELAVGGSNVIPKVPDRVVTPYLSPAQQETWYHLSRFQGQLWGVSIDHGGDPDMERELGAEPKAIPPIRRRPIQPAPPVAKDVPRGHM